MKRSLLPACRATCLARSLFASSQGSARVSFHGLLGLLAAAVVAGQISAAEFTVEKTPPGGAAVMIDGKPFATYVVDQGNKPYLWPIHAANGSSMTRSYPMQEVEGEKRDHPHQRGLTFGHESIGGIDTWSEAKTYEGARDPAKAKERLAHLGNIRHRGFRELSGGPRAVIHATADHVAPDGRKIVTEDRRMTFGVDGDARWIDVDLDLVASEGPVTILDKKDAGLLIRVPHSMSVDAGQGGKIVNSEGQQNADAWAKRATWCDYHGPVGGETLGIAILNHPDSFRHPTPWHVRTYGLFAANPFGTSSLDPAAPDGAVTLAAGERLSLRHRFIFHEGDEKQGRIAEAYADYAGTPRPAMAAAKPGE